MSADTKKTDPTEEPPKTGRKCRECGSPLSVSEETFSREGRVYYRAQCTNPECGLRLGVPAKASVGRREAKPQQTGGLDDGEVQNWLDKSHDSGEPPGRGAEEPAGDKPETHADVWQAPASAPPDGDLQQTTAAALGEALAMVEAGVGKFHEDTEVITGKLTETQTQIRAHGTAIDNLKRRLDDQLAEITKSYGKLTAGFKDSGTKYQELTQKVGKLVTAIERTKEIETGLVQESQATKAAAEKQEAANNQLLEQLTSSLPALVTAVESQRSTISELEGAHRAWYTSLQDFGRELLEREVRQYREQMEETRDRLIKAQAKVEEEFRNEFHGLRESYKAVTASMQQFGSPEGLLQLLRAYQTAAAADLDENARVALLERLPGLLLAVEKELAPWQLKEAGDTNEPIEVTRDGQVLLAGAPATGDSEKVSSAEVQLVTKVVVRTLEKIQTRIVKWLKDSGLERFPNPGESFDESLHRLRESVPTDRREDDHKIRRVLFSGLRLSGNGKKLCEAVVDVWKYQGP